MEKNVQKKKTTSPNICVGSNTREAFDEFCETYADKLDGGTHGDAIKELMITQKKIWQNESIGYEPPGEELTILKASMDRVYKMLVDKDGLLMESIKESNTVKEDLKQQYNQKLLTVDIDAQKSEMEKIDLIGQVEDLRLKLEEVNNKCSLLDQVNEELTQKESNHEGLNIRLETLEMDLKSDREQLVLSEMKVSQLTTALDMRTQESVKLEARIDWLREENARLKSAYDKKVSEAHQLEIDLVTIRAQCGLLERENPLKSN